MTSDGAGAGDPEGDDAAGGTGDDAASDGSGAGDGADGGPAAEPGSARRHRADETVRTDALPDAIRCPHCGEKESEQFSSFGSAVSVSQYYCRSCRTVFEAFKWR